MKRKKWIFLLAFLCGVGIVNLIGSSMWVNYSLLNRYTLEMLSFKEISYDVYFVRVLLLRLKTLIALWIFGKFVSKRIAAIGFGCLICVMTGGIFTMSILANGMWGVLLIMVLLFPHGIFYVLAYLLWYNSSLDYNIDGSRKERWLVCLLILLLIVIGSVCEAYVCPFLVENIIYF